MLKLTILVAVLVGLTGQLVRCQLPEDMQRELNQNLAEQARIQAMREQHQRQIKNRQSSAASPPASQARQQPAHDPNNYSYQQVSPPIQYSYYQPYGDAAAQSPAPQQRSGGGSGGGVQQAPVKFDLNDLNFDIPTQPQTQAASQRSGSPDRQQHLTPSFTGAGGLPVLRPITSQQQADVPIGNAPLPPQARVQQGPPLTEADFKDITGGENYGASGDGDFGLGAPAAGSNSRADNTDAQLREFGMPANGRASSQSPSAGGGMLIPDFGAFGPVGGSSGGRRQDSPFTGNNFGNFGAGGSPGDTMPNSAGNTDFDFASQPSSARGDQAAGVMNGGAPGSLQSLLGSSFPGLGASQNNVGGLDGFARGGNNPQSAQRSDDGALDIADMGDKSDGFSGADLGNFEQPTPQNDQDFNYAAASNQQPASVPYPDGNPQPVGTLWALTQPQSLTQTRYNSQLDKGTYQDYPAYLEESNEIAPSVSEVVDATPRPRAPSPGRYGIPSPRALAPEYRSSSPNSHHYDYSRSPSSSAQESGYHYE